MNKTVITLISTLLLLMPSVLSSGIMNIEYSTDNLTWSGITRIKGANQEAYQINLKERTIYYFRGKNDTTDWTYFSQRTKGESIYLSVFLSLMIITFLILFYKEVKDKEEYNLNLVYVYLFTLLLTTLLSVFYINRISDITSPSIFFIIVMLVVITLIYFIITFIRDSIKQVEI